MARNLIACLIVVLVLALIVVLGGCQSTGMKLDVETPDKRVSMDVDYQIEDGLKIYRDPATGELMVELGSATTKDTELGVVAALVGMMQSMMQTMATQQPYPPAPQPPDDS